MGKKIVMLPAAEVDLAKVKYNPGEIEAPDMTGIWLRIFVMLLEMPLIGSVILSYLKKQNKIQEMLRETVIPEPPMFRPEYPPQEQEPGVVCLEEEDEKSQDRVESAIRCLPQYEPAASRWSCDMPLASSFRYWKIRDYAYAYRSKITTPSMVGEYIISAIDVFSNKKPPAPLLVSFIAEDVRKQAAASTQRFKEGKPLSALDGIFMAIKDDIDCYPHPSKGGTTWFHEVHRVEKDAVCVSRLRRCGVILVGKANMHEFGQGTTGNNINYGITRNPHDPQRYPGGSSSGPAAIVASGICSAALGTDGGGSVRIPSSLCGVVGLKTTFGRTDLKGALSSWGTIEVIGPIASSVEDIILVYAAILGASPADKISLRPSLPCLPDLSSSHENSCTLGSLRLGKYTEWFNDVFSPDISTKCESILNLLSETHGCQIVEVVIPELHQIRTSHLVSVGAESLASLRPHSHNGNDKKLTLDTRTNMALFQSFTASDYVAAQRLRRRAMYYHMEVFKTVDVIITPTTGMTAPVIRPQALKTGETNMKVTGNLMRFVLAENLLGLPAISVPVGYDNQGLPIGLQIIGRPWGEATILRLAAAFEELRDETKKPVSYFNILKGY
ncbi:fatty acid amide hydrolase-like [Rutidosis leptorrhynchoides]|uniref:fatty acid amide hydrolase-like n=1 Tax=Rutidosis leptorrhynchoides TaxID=125765 RepID=UPI003A99F8FE